MRKIEFDVEQYIDDFEKGYLKIEDISKKENIKVPTVRKRLNEYYARNNRKRPNFRSLSKKVNIDFDISKYISDLESGLISQIEISRIERISIGIVRSRISEYYKMHGVEKPNFIAKKESTKKTRKDYVYLYKDVYERGEITLTAIAMLEGMSLSAVSRRFKKANIKKIQNNNLEEYLDAFLNHKITIEQIAEKEGVTPVTIRRRIVNLCEKNSLPPPNFRKLNRHASRIQIDVAFYIEKYRNSEISIAQIAELEHVSEITVRSRIKEYCKEIGIPDVIEEKRKSSNREFDISKYIEDFKAGRIKIIEIAVEENVSTLNVKRAIKAFFEKSGIQNPNLREIQRKDIDIVKYIEDYKCGKITQHQIALKEEVSDTRIHQILKEYFESRGEKFQRPKKREIHIEQYISDYEARNITQQGIAIKEGVSVGTIKSKIDKYYKTIGRPKPKRIRKSVDFEKYRADYEAEKITEEEIAERQGVQVSSVRSAIYRYYKNIEDSNSAPKTQEKSVIEDYIFLYEQGLITPHQIALKTKMDIKKVKSAITKYYKKGNKKPPKFGVPQNIIIEYLKRGLSKEQIRESARKRNIIIPETAFESAIKRLEEYDAKKP